MSKILQQSDDMELTVDNFKLLIQNMDKGDKSVQKAIIFKFGATWCKPCQDIKEYCNKCIQAMPKTVTCYEVDIDEHIEIYTALKSKKMIKGVPSLLAYVNKSNRDMAHWYVSDISVSGSNRNNITLFFQTIKNYN